MTTPTNWPDPNRPGVPLFPERGGNHWLAGRYCPDRWRIAIWDAHNGVWLDENMSPDMYVAHKCIYGGPALNPSELAQMRKDERERAANVCERYAAYAHQKYKRTEKETSEKYWMGASDSALMCANDIRTLPDEEGKKS